MSECLVLRHPQKNGYAYVTHRGKSCLAHRVAWELEHGPIPDGVEIHHTCRNRVCENVEHLELVTRKAHRALHRTCDHDDRYTNASGASVCRVCVREYKRGWLERNRAHRREYLREWKRRRRNQHIVA